MIGFKRCGPFQIKLGRRTPADQVSVELISPVTSQTSASSTIVLPSNSPTASLSTSFLQIRAEPRLTEPLLTSTPNTTFTPAYYSPSALPSPVPSPVYSMPAPLRPLQPDAFLPGPPTPAPPRLSTLTPTAVSFPQSPMYCDMRSLRAQLRPIRPAPITSPLFAAPPQLVIPEPRGARVVRLPGRTVNGAAINGGLDLRVNRPCPDSQVFSDKLKKILSKVSPLLVFYESQGENLFLNPSIRDLYKKNLNDVQEIVESANNLL